jgi:hypothetical protein
MPTLSIPTRDRAASFLALLVCALARLPGLLLGVEHYGDAPVRVEIAERWLRAPHLFRGISDAYQYGPVHLMMLGGALRLYPNRLVSPRLLSFAFALAGVWLLYWLARRVTSTAGALLAGVILSLDTVHMQAGSSAASEAIFLAMLLGTIWLVFAARDGLWALGLGLWEQPGSRAAASTALLRVTGAGLLLGLASLVRYDGLIYAALICGWLCLDLTAAIRARAPDAAALPQSPKSKVPRREGCALQSLRVRLVALLVFGFSAAAFPIWWFARNQLDSGDALAPLRHVDQDHRALADQGLRYFGAVGYRLYCLFYWPVNVLVLSSPIVGLASLVGAVRALWRRTEGWQLAVLAWIPAAYFTFRGSVRADFRPMSRFVLMAAALSLPFAWDELVRVTSFVASLSKPLQRHQAAMLRGLTALAIALAIGTPLFFFIVSFHINGDTAEWARPLSPVSSVPPGIEQAARYLRDHAGPDDQVILDGVWDYLEIPLAFESTLPETSFTRLAYDNFEAKLKQVPPTMAVLFYQGNLQFLSGTKNAKWQSPDFDFRGLHFCREAEFVYAGVYRVCQ